MISVVVESWNIAGEPAPLVRVLAALARELGDAELVVTDGRGISAAARVELEAAARRPIRWVDLARDAGYYDHKNAGFDATAGDIVAFVDGDCEPAPGWLAAITDPIVRGEARVVAGATSYAGGLAPLANQLDFPYFELDRAGAHTTVRNFFANNVAFARDVFAARRYPAIAPMFHGQCQVLGLQLLADRIAIRLAPGARVVHAWPGSVAEWLEVRLLRGADTASLLPYVLAHYVPRAAPAVARLGRVPALWILGLRALTGAWSAVRRGPLVRGLALVAGVTVVDAIGVAAAPVVYRALG